MVSVTCACAGNAVTISAVAHSALKLFMSSIIRSPERPIRGAMVEGFAHASQTKKPR